MKYRTPNWTEQDWQNSYEEAINGATKFVRENQEKLDQSELNIARGDSCLSFEEWKKYPISVFIDVSPEKSSHFSRCIFCCLLAAHRIFIDNPPE